MYTICLIDQFQPFGNPKPTRPSRWPARHGVRPPPVLARVESGQLEAVWHVLLFSAIVRVLGVRMHKTRTN